MIVCSALLISAAIDSVSSDIASIVWYLPSAICSCCATYGDGEDLGDRLERVDVLLVERVPAAATRGSACRPRGPSRSSGTISTEPKPDVCSTLASRKSGAALGDVVDDQRLARAHDAAEQRSAPP